VSKKIFILYNSLDGDTGGLSGRSNVVYSDAGCAFCISVLKYELTRPSRLNNTRRVRDISYVAFNVLNLQSKVCTQLRWCG